MTQMYDYRTMESTALYTSNVSIRFYLTLLLILNGMQPAIEIKHFMLIGDHMSEILLKKILVVDDEKSILMTLSHLLRHVGVEVVVCSEVEQAEAALNIGNFDLVIADIRMSGVAGIEGLELLTYIKEHYATEVIIMTGYGTPEIEAEAYKRGAFHFFRKPIDPSELLGKVAELGIPVKL